MKLLTASLVLIGILAGTAGARELEIVEGGYEARLGNVTLPSSIAGTALFRTCDSCDTIGLRVSGSTVFQVSGGTMPLDDFLRAVQDIRDQDGQTQRTLVSIYYDIESEIVTRINVLPPRG